MGTSYHVDQQTVWPHLHGFTPINILVYKPSTPEDNTLFEMSISRKTNKFWEFFQSAY